MLLILWYIFIASAVLLTVYHLFSMFSILAHKSIPKENKAAVSVIVCAHNAHKNLKNLVPAVLQQNHPDFELIVVDDRSTDETYGYLKEQTLNEKKVKLVRIDETPDHLNEKKYALILGIKAARNDLILLTDADCIPVSEHWISEMSRPFLNTKINIALGFSPYQPTKGFLNGLIRYETFLTAITYFTLANIGMPYMGVGRNLAYRKSFFFERDGFKGFQKVLGGDDDLFVNRNAKKSNTVVVFNEKAITKSMPKSNWGEYFIQKTRHLSVGKYYHFKHRVVLGLLFLTKLLFWLTLPAVILAEIKPIVTISGFILVMVSFLTTYILFRKKLKDLKGAWGYPVLDIIYLFYYILVGLKVKFTKKVKWS